MLFASPLTAIGCYDMVQTQHSLRRNYPLFGCGRWLIASGIDKGADPEYLARDMKEASPDNFYPADCIVYHDQELAVVAADK